MSHYATARYLPESMIITLGPELRILDESSGPVAFPTASAFGFFFHEYVHYLHNISTVSGMAAFFNKLELLKLFTANNAHGGNVVTETCSTGAEFYTTELLPYLKEARVKHTPDLKLIITPVGIEILSCSAETVVTGSQGVLLTALACLADVEDQGGQREQVTLHIGTLELLESAAWLLEKRAVSAVSCGSPLNLPPIFPNRVVEALAAYLVPGIEEEVVLACVLGSLQSSDAPAALPELLEIARNAMGSGREPLNAVRDATKIWLAEAYAPIMSKFAELQTEFSNDGILALGIKKIIAAARHSFQMRQHDPFFELEFIAKLADRRASINDILSKIPACAVLQKNSGKADAIQRDILVSFLPATPSGTPDAEDGLRVVHAVFHYVETHMRRDGLALAGEGRDAQCPFYSCCDLGMRVREPSLCRSTPSQAASWPHWDAQGQCWYGSAVKVTQAT